jgi:hypothetical protein
MIVLIDVENKIINLYNECGLKKIPFKDSYILQQYSEPIYYITNAIETTSDQIIDFISDIQEENHIQDDTIRFSNELIEKNELIEENYYLHNVSEKTSCIPDLNIYFKGKYDCKLLDDKFKYVVQKSKVLQNLIKIGELEIIGENKKRELLVQQKQIKEKKQERVKSNKDTIIINKPVNEFVSDLHDAEEIDLTEEIKNVSTGGETT